MTKKMEYALLDILEEFAKETFNFVGKDAAQEWAIRCAESGFDSSKLTKEERFYHIAFKLAQCCHKIKLYKKESEEMFSSLNFF